MQCGAKVSPHFQCKSMRGRSGSGGFFLPVLRFLVEELVPSSVLGVHGCDCGKEIFGHLGTILDPKKMGCHVTRAATS